MNIEKNDIVLVVQSNIADNFDFLNGCVNYSCLVYNQNSSSSQVAHLVGKREVPARHNCSWRQLVKKI